MIMYIPAAFVYSFPNSHLPTSACGVPQSGIDQLFRDIIVGDLIFLSAY